MNGQRYNEWRILFCRLLAAGVVWAAAPTAWAQDKPQEDFNKLERELRLAYEAGNYEKALESGKKMLELRPDDMETTYNVACLHCLLGHKKDAYEWLEKAVDAGFDDAEHLVNDDDFKTIRGEDRFRAIVKKLRGEVKEKAVPKKPEKREPAADEKQPEKAEKPKPAEKTSGPQLSEEETREKVLELTQQLIEASDAKQKHKALALALEARLLADIGLTNYNVACMYSILGKKDEAFRYLDRSIELGGFAQDMAAQIEGDKDFKNIRGDTRYKKALEKAKGKGPSQAPGAQVEPEWEVTVPKGFDKSKAAPLIVALHGHGQNMGKAVADWKEAAAKVGAVLLTPQGTIKHGDDRYEWGGNVDLVEENVMDAVDQIREDYEIDEEHIVIVGFSQGGWLAWHLAVRNPDMFRGVIPVAGRCTGLSDGAFQDEGLNNLRAVVMLGEDDDETLLDENRKAVKLLKEQGAEAKLRVYKGVGHGFPEDAVVEQVEALKFVLRS